jgi:hypothetical protein
MYFMFGAHDNVPYKTIMRFMLNAYDYGRRDPSC